MARDKREKKISEGKAEVKRNWQDERLKRMVRENKGKKHKGHKKQKKHKKELPQESEANGRPTAPARAAPAAPAKILAQGTLAGFRKGLIKTFASASNKRGFGLLMKTWIKTLNGQKSLSQLDLQIMQDLKTCQKSSPARTKSLFRCISKGKCDKLGLNSMRLISDYLYKRSSRKIAN